MNLLCFHVRRDRRLTIRAVARPPVATWPGSQSLDPAPVLPSHPAQFPGEIHPGHRIVEVEVIELQAERLALTLSDHECQRPPRMIASRAPRPQEPAGLLSAHRTRRLRQRRRGLHQTRHVPGSHPLTLGSRERGAQDSVDFGGGGGGSA